MLGILPRNGAVVGIVNAVLALVAVIVLGTTFGSFCDASRQWLRGMPAPS